MPSFCPQSLSSCACVTPRRCTTTLFTLHLLAKDRVKGIVDDTHSRVQGALDDASSQIDEAHALVQDAIDDAQSALTKHAGLLATLNDRDALMELVVGKDTYVCSTDGMNGRLTTQSLSWRDRDSLELPPRCDAGTVEGLWGALCRGSRAGLCGALHEQHQELACCPQPTTGDGVCATT